MKNQNEQYAQRADYEAAEYAREAKRAREAGHHTRAQKMTECAESQRQTAASYRRR